MFSKQYLGAQDKTFLILIECSGFCFRNMFCYIRYLLIHLKSTSTNQSFNFILYNGIQDKQRICYLQLPRY
jgi:hypothetical protein